MRGGLGLVIVALALGAAPLHAADPSPSAAAGEAIAPAPAGPVIAGARAGDYVGQDVTVEGRVSAIHESPLATVIGFSPNFAGFTATILAADRDKFPSDLQARVQNRVVRVSGTVTAYRGKPEMALREPSQLLLTPPPVAGSITAPIASPAAVPTTDVSTQELRRALARIEARLQSLEDRLSDLEDAAGAPPESAAPAQPNR
jgi:hypothetical protein